MANAMEIVIGFLKENNRATWKQIVACCGITDDDHKAIAEELVTLMSNGWITKKQDRNTGNFYYALTKKELSILKELKK